MKLRLAVALWLTATSAFAGSRVTAAHAAVVSSSPIATKAGIDVLQRGGNAADAAVAMAFVLSVTYPQASPIGGGGFLLYYDAEQRAVWALDFSEMSPRDLNRDAFGDRVPSGIAAAGVPGTVAGLDALHKRFGKRPWPELLAPSAAVAREGFSIDYELERSLSEARKSRGIEKIPSTKAVFFPDEGDLKVGSRLVQPDLAATLERIAAGGTKEFYEGDTARRMIDSARLSGATVSYRDLREYQPLWRAPLQVKLGENDIYLASPPAAGGVFIASALQMLMRLDIAATPYLSSEYVHLLTEVSRRASLDRARFTGDPVGARLPYRELLSTDRAAAWARSIDRNHVTPTATLVAPPIGSVEAQNTTHYSVVDADGNVASVTVSLAGEFGSGFVIPGTGFFMNAAMSNFAVTGKTANGESLVTGAANALDSRKRPAWSATPTLVVRNGRVVLAAGSSGGARIPTTMLQTLLGTIVYRQTLAATIDAPRYHQQGLPEEVEYEAARAPSSIVESLGAKGHPTAALESIGSVQAIAMEDGKIIAISDPRHGGAAGGY